MLLPAICCDTIYVASEIILNKGDNNALYFCHMNQLCEIVEHDFGLFTNLWYQLQHKCTSKILQEMAIF